MVLVDSECSSSFFQPESIPAGRSFLMNMWAGNRDPEHFKSLMLAQGLSTMDMARKHGYVPVHISPIVNFLAFHVRESASVNLKGKPILDTIDCNSVTARMVTQAKPFKVKFIPRNAKRLEGWISSSFEKTAHLQA
ncbi:uncharacterized protein N7469_005567 [Penicillium citrinum]|uniref:Uncharacterized protein n=1 Tax=Penicillium citrinum TaxID=5077 RepID=A0A9W9P1Y7_PENCI|nr:uncharacterized protein N7469_005567 [Penicillium citrinum]KAJ5233801.1 hypothetical protein N7469_005567 [Penicillium citrinum]